MHDIHGLQGPLGLPRIAHREIKTRICQLQAGASYHARFAIVLIYITEGKDIYVMAGKFEVAFIQFDKIRNAADVRLVTIHHHSDSHEPMLRHARMNVKYGKRHGRMKIPEVIMSAKLVLRDKEYEVRAGMTLLAALKKSNIVPESVIATRDGEMILEDEILKNGDIIKLIAVISGG